MAHINRLKDAHVLVFGGTSGMGYAIASMALSYGARVTISGSTQEKADKKVASLRELYPDVPAAKVAGYAGNLLDKPNLEAVIKNVLEKATDGGKNKIDHIAWCAGDWAPPPAFKEIETERVLSLFTTRFLATSFLVKLLVTEPGKYMPEATSSSITLTSGTNTHRPIPGWGIIAAVGASVEGLMRGIAVDLKPIRCNAVVPGAIQTELLQPLIDNNPPEVGEKMRKGYSHLEVWGQPEDIAEAYAWPMRDRFVDGQLITCDGARLLKPTEV